MDPSPDRQTEIGPALAIEASLEAFRAQIFNLLLITTSLILGLLALRGFLFNGIHPKEDLLTLGAMVLGYGLVRRHPGWNRPLSWLMLLCLQADAIHGIIPWHDQALSPAHLLLPLLVLYGTLLGELWMSLASMVLALGVYGLTARHYQPLDGLLIAEFTNLGLLTVCAGGLSLALWKYHDLLIHRLKAQTLELHHELEENQQLQAIIFHDIANPLTAIKLQVEMLSGRPQMAKEAGRLDHLASKIFSIIYSVRLLTTRHLEKIALAPVSLPQLAESLRETFLERLVGKDLQLEVEIPEQTFPHSHGEILEHSILSNLLSNAIKFSPRGSRITLTAEARGDQIQIRLHNPGAVLPESVLKRLRGGRAYASSDGTEGESGTGHGLQIVALTVAKLKGSLAFLNEAEGVTAVLTLPGSLRESS